MQFKVNDGPGAVYHGRRSDHVSGEMPWKLLRDLCAGGEIQ